MGGKKIGACDAQGVASPVPQGGGERLTTGSGGKSSVGYAGIVKMGLSREGREVLGGVNGNTNNNNNKSSSSPDRIGDCASGVVVVGAAVAAAAVGPVVVGGAGASAAGVAGGGMKANVSNGMSTSGNRDVVVVDSCTVVEQQRPLDEALGELSLQCVVGGEIIAGTPPQLEAMRPSLAIECLPVETGGSNGEPAPVERGGGEVEMVENGGDHEQQPQHMSQDQWQPPGMDFQALDASSRQQQQQQQQQSQQLVREFDVHRSHAERGDFRPPSLILPDATSVESNFAAASQHHQQQQQQQQASETDFRPPQSFLPASLVMSPHDGKPNLLDPNAREFTPSPSPCPSPSPPSLVSIVQPPPYHMEQQQQQPPPHVPYAPPPAAVELGPVMYSTDYNGAPMMPIYANGAPLFGPISGSQTPPWETAQHMGIGMQGGELSHHMSTGSGPLAPPPMVGQHPPHLLRPYVSAPTMHSFIPSGCSPPIGSPTGRVPAFAVPPPLTGREHVSRALLLSGVPTELTDYALKQELEQWGLVRALGLERRHEGLVTTHYYDLRHSKEALRDIQQQHLLQQQRMQQKFQQQMQRQRSSGHVQSADILELEKQDVFKDPSRDEDVVAPPARGLIGGKAVWAQYTVPVGTAAGLDSHNQGTLVVFNLDVDMPLDDLRAAFEAHGAVKELRETPAKRQHKFVEFYDVRDAAKALEALDGHEIGGKRVKIEFSRPGGQARRARAQAQAQVLAHQGAAAAAASLVPLVGNRLNAAVMPGAIQGQPMYLGWGTDPSMGPAQSMAAPPGPPPHYLWPNFQHVSPAGPPIAPLGTLVQQQQQQWNVGHGQLQSLPYQQIQGGPPSPGLGSVPGLVPIGSEGAHNRQFGRGGGYCGGPCSPGSSFHSGGITASFGRGSSNYYGGGGGGGVGVGSVGAASGRGGNDEPTGRRRRGGGATNSNGSVLKMDLACLPSSLAETKPVLEGSRDSPRSGKTGLTPKSSPREHALYVFNADQAEMNSDSPRTTLMIKNIPNKYSQSMLLALLDQHCLCCNQNIVDPNEPQSGYDFVYLPIDFKNRCNLGYAFVNFTSVQATLKLYKSFHAQQWEAFNSRKICQVTYARVQGRAALEEHFRNSRFACDTDEYLPLVFSPPRTGIVCPPPIVAAGHLAGRALICSPRGEAQGCRSNRNSEPQSEKSGGDPIQREAGNGSSDQDSESSVGSSGNNGPAAAAAVAASGSSHGRRPNGQHR
ncbi:unnamed protein product [Calypogeia fissa]